METLFTFLVALSLYLALRAMRGGSHWLADLSGLVAGGATLTRSPYLVVAVGLLTYWAVLSARQRAAWIQPTLFALVLALPLAAWTLRNEIDLGTPIVTVTESGYVFYQGNSRGAIGDTTG